MIQGTAPQYRRPRDRVSSGFQALRCWLQLGRGGRQPVTSNLKWLKSEEDLSYICLDRAKLLF